MRLDLLRHGVASAVADVVSGDRPLTPEGIAELIRLGRTLRARGWRPDRVWASPLRRAQDSARIVTREAEVTVEVGTLADLDPAVGTWERVAAALEDFDPAGHVLLVGHQPLLGQLAWGLSGAETRFPPAALAMLECSSPPRRGACRRVGLLVPGTDF